MTPQKQEAYRRAAERVHRAKNELLDALSIAESEGLRWTARIGKRCGDVEALERTLSDLAKGTS